MNYKHIIDECVGDILDYIEESNKRNYTMHLKRYDIYNIVSRAVEAAAKEAVEAYEELVEGADDD